MAMDKHPGYYYTPNEWARLGMQGPLPDERNRLLQREFAEMKINEVAEPVRRRIGGLESVLRYGNNGKVYRVNDHCWYVKKGEQEGLLCDRREREGGDWSRSARGKEDGPTEYVFVEAEFVDGKITLTNKIEVYSSIDDAKSEVTLQSIWPE